MRPINSRPKQIIIAIILLLAVSSIGIFYFYSNRLTDNNVSVNTLQEGDLSISAAMTHAPNGDVKNDKKLQGGDVVRFSFQIENKSDREAESVTLNTDIEKSLIFDVKNIQGTTGLDNQGSALIFHNLAIQPKQSLIISFDATLVFSDQERSLRLQPKLFDSTEKFMAQGSPQKYSIDKNENSDLPSNVKTEGP